MSAELRAPFPYHGAKGQQDVVDLCWRAMGVDVPTYIEPFGGSAAMLLTRPGGPGKYEVVNDANGLIVNVWRAIKHKPDEVAALLDEPPSELELRVRARRLRELEIPLLDCLESHEASCSPLLAAWWVWCQCVSFSPDWLRQKNPPMAKPYRRGILSPESDPRARLAALSERLRRVSFACGDWSRLVTASALGFNNTGTTPAAVFLDPVYPDEALDYGAADPDVARKVETWCRENGNDERLRVVLCGHSGDYELPGWRVVNWGGSRGWGHKRRGLNECAWLSPHCLPLEQPKQLPLLSGLEA